MNEEWLGKRTKQQGAQEVLNERMPVWITHAQKVLHEKRVGMSKNNNYVAHSMLSISDSGWTGRSSIPLIKLLSISSSFS